MQTLLSFFSPTSISPPTGRESEGDLCGYSTNRPAVNLPEPLHHRHESSKDRSHTSRRSRHNLGEQTVVDANSQHVHLRERNRDLEQQIQRMEQETKNIEWGLKADLRDLGIEKQRLEKKVQYTNNHITRLEEDNRQQSEHMRYLGNQIKQEKERHAQTMLLLEERTKELKDTQTFFNHADTLSGADIIALINSLNAEIFQAAALVADTIELGRLSPQTDAWMKASDNLLQILGRHLIQTLGSQHIHADGGLDPTLVQLALQSCIAYFCSHVVHTWFSGDDQWVKTLHARIQSKEKPVVAGNWRMLTRKHLLEVKDVNFWLPHLKNCLLEVLAISGYSQSPESQHISAKLDEKLKVICDVTLRLQAATGESITSADFEATAFRSKTPFDSNNMEDTNDSRNRPDGEPITGTVELGLTLCVNGSVKTVLRKAKVFFQSSLPE